jgi:signal peptidase I
MKSLSIAIMLLLVLMADGYVFATNPLHVPGDNLPARLLGVQSFQQLDPSMEPTLPEKKSFLVSAWTYWHAAPRQGDVVAFLYPPRPSEADVKRIVAVGGSTVEIRNAVVYVDGKVLEEPYLHSMDPKNRMRNMTRITVPAGKYFVMGDNRDQSEDSRRWGPIAREAIIGRFWF